MDSLNLSTLLPVTPATPASRSRRPRAHSQERDVDPTAFGSMDLAPGRDQAEVKPSARGRSEPAEPTKPVERPESSNATDKVQREDGSAQASETTDRPAAGGTQEADQLYLAFRGRLPGVDALLKGRGLSAVT